MNIGLIQPYWESSSSYEDSSFLSYSPSYKAMWESLAQATGGQAIRYSMSDATVDNIASTLEQCGLVIFDSHGNTDYENPNDDEDYTSQANTSYLCLTSSAGLTTADTADAEGDFGSYYHALVYSGGAFIDGTVIANHMTQNAPHSLLYMGICLGMATDGMEAPLRAKGVEAVYGYSQSVSFKGEEKYMKSILGYLRDGDNFASALSKTKSALGSWDPAYPNITEAQAVSNRIAFPIVASSEDNYPGHGNVDAVQTVYSTWELYSKTVTAFSNNADWGTVSVNGYTITAAPENGYYASGYAVTSGTATVTRNGNVFTVDPETNCTVRIDFAHKIPATVTVVAGSTTLETYDTYLEDEVNLPISAVDYAGWEFVGWVEQTLEETTEKPAYYKPGDAYTVTDVYVTLYALYARVEGSVCYELVTETLNDWAGTYVISSGRNSGMYVMTGVSGDDKIESTGHGVTALTESGIRLDETVLTEVDEAYLFDVESVGNGVYSIQSESEGSYLAICNQWCWTRANYESAYCDWTLTASDSGVIMQCINESSYPYLSWSGSKWAASSGNAEVVQLWKRAGDFYYFTAPVVEAHDHVWTSWASNQDGTHSRSCTVCGREETNDCSFSTVVTAPTVTEQGYTTHTCTLCGYSYEDDFVQALGMDYTVSFSVPLECELPNDMISNTNRGITLPVISAPEGYKFLGWVERAYDNVGEKPAVILTGKYVAQSDVTLYALFKYVVDNGSGETGFELVTEDLSDWTGSYVITCGKTASLYAMKGMDDGVSYESSGNGSAVAYADTGMTLNDGVLTDVGDAFIFEIALEESGNYSIQNVGFETFVGISSGTLKALGTYAASTCDYNLALQSEGDVSACLAAGGSYPYIAFTTSSNKFWCYSSSSGIYFWKQSALGTPYWTTVIGEADPGVDYVLRFTTPNGVAAPAPMTVNSYTGAILPTVTAPEGYTFCGWVLEDCDNMSAKPAVILSGRYRPQSNLTLKALFSYISETGESAYQLVTEAQDDWTGNYVITCNKDAFTMIVMHGVGADMTYEHADSYGMYELADTEMAFADNVLYNPGENYVFAVEAQDGGYSIQNLGSSNYVGRYEKAKVQTSSASVNLIPPSAAGPSPTAKPELPPASTTS